MLRLILNRKATLQTFSGQFVQLQLVNEHVAEIILTRPEKLNALTLSMAKEISFTCTQLEGDKSVRAVIVRGEGRSFCSGRDLKQSMSHSDAEAEEYLNVAVAAVMSVFHLPMPTIAAIQGCALGFGLELALACDFRIASHDCKLGFPETKLGIFPGAGGSFLLPVVLGSPSKALEWVLLADQYSAEEAKQAGVVNWVVEDANIEAVSVANRLAGNGPLGVRAAKRVLKQGIHSVLESTTWQDDAMTSRLALANSADYHEALKAFFEKRQPNFKGE